MQLQFLLHTEKLFMMHSVVDVAAVSHTSGMLKQALKLIICTCTAT